HAKMFKAVSRLGIVSKKLNAPYRRTIEKLDQESEGTRRQLALSMGRFDWEACMGTETPLAPPQHQYDVTIYIVLDQFGGAFGRAYRETDESYADEHTTINKISDGAYSRPVRVVAFNTDEGWSRDVSEEIALKLLDLSREGHSLGAAAREFVERVTGK